MTPAASSWPVVDMAETLRRLTAPGAPFEMQEVEVGGRKVRSYLAAVPHMRAVFDASRAYGERDFLVYEGERLSFEAHWRAAATLAHALGTRFGIRRGDRVAVALRNFPEWSVCAWAVLAIGAVLVPLNAWEPGSSLARMIDDSGSRLVFADSERLERLSPHRTDLPSLMGVRTGGADSLESILGNLGNYGALDPPLLPDLSLDADDVATIFYTSGTTGAAKGAVGSHRNIATNLVNVAFRAARAALRRGGDVPSLTAGARRVQLLPLPFFHVTGFHSALAPALANGATLVLMHKWDAERALDLIEIETVNALTLVPSQAMQLVDSPSLGDRDLSSVDAVGYGGAAAAPWLARRVCAVFPNAFPGQGYGATETSSLVAANSAEDMLARPDSVGIAVPCCGLKILREDGREAAPGEAGEIWVSGPNVVRGYWNLPEATSEGFVEGWYRTGDIGAVDAEGFVILFDRAKDMLIRGGENIYCVEIEDVLLSHPSVIEAAVFGVPEPVYGEVVGAVVRLREGQDTDLAVLKDHVAAHLAVHKVPIFLELRHEPFPRNAAGKALKRQLRAEVLERVT